MVGRRLYQCLQANTNAKKQASIIQLTYSPNGCYEAEDCALELTEHLMPTHTLPTEQRVTGCVGRVRPLDICKNHDDMEWWKIPCNYLALTTAQLPAVMSVQATVLHCSEALTAAPRVYKVVGIT